MTEAIAFITHLEGLAKREDRGALAALRRGLGQPPGTVAAMYPHVVPWLPADARPWLEATYYLMGALYALHPAPGGTANLGASFRQAEAREGDERAADERVSAIERRFTALLAAHPEDLPDRLRQAVSFLASREVPVNWHQLFRDVARWGDPSRRVQNEWARAYWGRNRQATEDPIKEN
ncbi:MAG: type I-E CRISPR-associated protein Cse2/CasB [Anaerolineae bacterium]